MISNHLIFSDLIFDHPRSLFLLFFLIPTILLMIIHYRKKQKVFRIFFQKYDEAEQSTLIYFLNGRYITSSFFFIIFLACVIISLAGPRFGWENVAEQRRGLDVVFAFDVSRSMNAQDVSPSRLIRASLLAQELVRQTPGMRFAAALGKGSGVLAIPLTDDSEALLTYLNSVSNSALTSQGTNLENLIRAAMSGFQDSVPTQRRIILFSDGEALDGNINSILQDVQNEDIGIISVALGYEEGSPIPVEGGVLKNPDGSTVMSYLHSEVLMQAAERSGGVFIDGNQTDAFARLKNLIQSLSSEDVSSGFRREQKSWWHLFLIAALISYGISRLIESGWRRKNQ
jgi:Ca-activated chloride channel family protein